MVVATSARTRALVLASALLLVTAPVFARAPGDPSAAPPGSGTDASTAQAREHFNRASALYDEGHPEAALLELRRAYDLKPNYRLLFNIGELAFTTHDYVGSLRSFEQFLAAGGDEIEPAKRAEAKSRIGTLRALVGELRVGTRPLGAVVSIDDDVIGPTPLASPSVVGAGRHHITATKEGFLPASQVVTVLGGERTEAELQLSPIFVAGAAPRSLDDPTPSRWTTLSFLGIGASTVLAASAVTMFVVSGKANADLANYQFAGTTPPQDFYDQQTAVKSGRAVGVALGAAAVITLGTTLALTLLRKPPAKPSGARAQAGVLLGGFAFAGAF